MKYHFGKSGENVSAFWKRKTIFDYIQDGKLDDAALAMRMKEWISGKKPEVAKRTIRLYWKQPEEKRASLAAHGLTEKFIRKYEKRLGVDSD